MTNRPIRTRLERKWEKEPRRRGKKNSKTNRQVLIKSKLTYTGIEDAMMSLKSKRNEIDNRFIELQTEKICRYQAILNERKRLHKLVQQMPTIRVIESFKNRKTKLDILEPLTTDKKRSKMEQASPFSSRRMMDFRNKSWENSQNQSKLASNYMTPTVLKSTAGAKEAILNFKTLEELNSAFFSHSENHHQKEENAK